jgi:deoxyxylulose-5-phosphate synthase
MLNTLKLYTNLKKTISEDAAREISETPGAIYKNLKNTVTKEDFTKLKQIVVDSKEETKKEISRIDQALSELAEAQKEVKISIKLRY